MTVSAADSPERAARTLLVKLADRPMFNKELRMPRGPERKAAVWNKLVETASQSQSQMQPLLDSLTAAGHLKSAESLVSPNMLILEADGIDGYNKVALAMQAADGVKAIYRANNGTKMWPEEEAPADAHVAGASDEQPWALEIVGEPREVSRKRLIGDNEVPWTLKMMKADEAQAAGFDGTGTVFGSIDTGVDWDHEALKHAYRGWNAESGEVSHDYNWFDASGRSPQEARDGHGHGTHTIGSVVGKTAGKTFGVAPGAKFISARGLTNAGIPGILKAMQFMQAPTDTTGKNPRPDLAPDVVGMSWRTGPAHGDIFEDSIKNYSAAGIEPVKSNGNGGPGPETGTAPGNFKEIFSTAAVDERGEIARFSSRGPSALPHGGYRKPLWKPDYAAPGKDVVSSMPGDRYASMSGTSMAQPHMSGAILAVLGAEGGAQHNRNLLDGAFARSATDAGAEDRDLEFGWGIVNVMGAIEDATRQAAATSEADPKTGA